MEFTTDTWISESDKTLYSSKRLLMIDDLFSKFLKVGMPSGAVIALLGNPEARFGEKRWRYELGPSVFGVDFEYLMIEFDAWTRVSKFYIQRS